MNKDRTEYFKKYREEHKDEAKARSHKSYLLNKYDGSFAQFNSYTDDITGAVQEGTGETLNFPEVLPGGKVYVLYRSIDLIGKDLAGIPDSDLPPSFFNQLQKIQGNLDEMDNPVLLVGSAKKNK